LQDNILYDIIPLVIPEKHPEVLEMFRKKKPLLGAEISPSCDYCQNCVVEGGKNFCRYKKAIKKTKCSKFDYNPT
jgi:hypothetical protein